MGSPYLSIVIVGRNDNYGHRFLYRVQNFLDVLTYLCGKNKLNAEILFVEWNPPKDQKKLWEDLKFNYKNPYCTIKFIEVPRKVHSTIDTSDRVPLFEFIAKNAGIRRAKGKFVLVTNPDMIFGDKMIKFLAQEILREDCFYRAPREDVEEDLPEGLDPEKVLKFCEKRWVFRFGVFFKELNPRMLNLKRLPLEIKLNVRNLGRIILMFFGRNQRHLWYHGGAPGDFMILSKEAWEKIRGFPELTLQKGHLDGYGTILAGASGLKLVNLKDKATYHQFHERPTGKATFDYNDYLRKANTMLKEKKIIQPNGKNWGLKGIELGEKIIN